MELIRYLHSYKAFSPNRVQPQTLKEIAGWVSGVKLAGEFERAKPEIINEMADEFNLDLIQLDTPYLIDEIEEINRPVIQKIFINKDTVVSELLEMMDLYGPYVDSFIIYSTDFETIDGTNEKLLKEVAKKHQVYIGFGLEKDNVSRIIEKVKPTGIGLQGGEEIRPGYKNFDEFQDIFEELED